MTVRSRHPVERREGSPSRRRLVPLLLIGLGLLALLGAIVTWRLGDRTSASPRAADLPDSVAGLRLSDMQVGTTAVENVTRLHGQSFPLESGAVGMYDGPDGAATVWVAGARSHTDAGQMVIAMRDRIAEGRSPFTPLVAQETASGTIYELEGMGQRHYYFQAGELVIWLGADHLLAEQALRDVLDFYRR